MCGVISQYKSIYPRQIRQAVMPGTDDDYCFLKFLFPIFLFIPQKPQQTMGGLNFL